MPWHLLAMGVHLSKHYSRVPILKCVQGAINTDAGESKSGPA